MSKSNYVKSQGQTRNHHCHWPGCDKQVPPAMWGCSGHWYKLPADLRTKVWAAYRPGQEINGTPSAAYVEVAKQVQEWINQNQPKKSGQPNLFDAPEPQDEAAPISRSEWIAQAKVVYLEAGDDEAMAQLCACHLCNEQDWLGGEVEEPRDAARDDINGRPAVKPALTEEERRERAARDNWATLNGVTFPS